MIRCPVLIAIEFGIGVINAGLALIEPLVAPVADPLWTYLAAKALPQEHTDAAV